MTFQEAIAKIQHGNCLLFTGAGFSLKARNIKGDEFRSAKYIAKDLYERCATPESDQNEDMAKASQWFLHNKGVDAIVKFLKEEFTVATISEDHKAIGKLTWRRCYTVNYDSIIERAYSENGRILTPVIPTDTMKEYNIAEVCIHLNGFIDRLNSDNIENSFKLTSRSYQTDLIKNTGWWDILDEDILVCDAIFVVGCSFRSDSELLRMLKRSKHTQQKVFFIVAPEESDINLLDLNDIGTPCKIGLSSFLEEISKVPVVDKPQKCLHFNSFYSPKIENNKPQRRRKDFTDLLTDGIVNEHLLDFSLQNPDEFHYCLHREKLDFVVNKIEEGASNFIVHSHLGNGKTVFIKALGQILIRKDYRVFIFNPTSLPSTIDELIQICQTFDNKVLIFENYSDNIDIIRKLINVKHDNTVLVFSERTSTYETSYPMLREVAPNPIVISLNELSDEEIEKLIVIIEQHGLWGEMSTASYARKKTFIATTCKRHLSAFVMYIVESDDLISRYTKAIEIIKNKEEHYKALLYIIIGNIIQLDLTFTNIIDDLDYECMDDQLFKTNPHLKEFVDFDKEKITFKSSILAKHITNKMLDYNDIVAPLITLFQDLNRKREIYRVKKILKNITIYSNLNKLFAKGGNVRGLNNAIFTFYDNISNCEYNQQNALFWLQYAIARLVDEDMYNAENCFQNAYAYAKETGFDTYQIDNHYAKFLLIDAIKKGNIANSIVVFRDIHTKLMATKKGHEYKYHSFKVASHYLDFYNAYRETFTASEIVEFCGYCNEMLQKIDFYLSLRDASEKDAVTRTKNNIMKILS